MAFWRSCAKSPCCKHRNSHCQTKYCRAEYSFLFHPFAPLTFENYWQLAGCELSIFQIFCIYQLLSMPVLLGKMQIYQRFEPRKWKVFSKQTPSCFHVWFLLESENLIFFFYSNSLIDKFFLGISVGVSKHAKWKLTGCTGLGNSKYFCRKSEDKKPFCYEKNRLC